MSNKVQNIITEGLSNKEFIECRSVNTRCGDKRGMPDVEIFYPVGKTIFVEVKSKETGDKIKKDGLQEFRLGKLRNMGHDVRIIKTPDEAHALVGEVLFTTKVFVIHLETAIMEGEINCG